MEEIDLSSQSGRLRKARQDAGYPDAKAFADAIGMKDVTYRAYEGGQNGFTKHIQRFSAKLGVSVEWLLVGGKGGKAPLPQLPSGAAPTPDLPPVRDATAGDASVEVRRVDLGYAMGDGTNIDDYPEEDSVRFDPGFLRSVTRSPADRLFVARGDGDSMQPTLINDDMVLIDMLQRTLNMQDRIWAVSVFGAGMIKRLRAIADGRVLVLSDNPNVPHQEVSADDLHIVGRVVWVGRRV